MQKIFILGFPHSGTSILKRIIGNAPHVHEHPFETNVVTEDMAADASAAGKSAIVVKDINFPWMPSYEIPDDTVGVISECKEFLADNTAARFVMLIKNPSDIFGSFNRRFPDVPEATRPAGHRFSEWETWAEVFLFFRTTPAANLFPITYEELFADDHARLRDLCAFVGVTFGPGLLDSARQSLIVANVSDVPADEPASRENGDDHGKFRTWQINQPIRDMTGESARYLDEETRQLIGGSRVAGRLGYGVG